MDYAIMGTNNKAVTAYLPEDIEARLAEFCLDNGLSRQGKKSGKDKPALGTGIVEVLRIFFSEEFDSSGAVSMVDKDELQAMVSETLPSTLPTQAWVKSEIQQAIAKLKAELEAKATVVEKKAVSKAPETVELPKAESPKEDVKEEKKNDILVLNQADLARRLRSNSSTLSRQQQKGGEHFAQWSKSKDPEKLAWQYRGTEDSSKMFETV